MKAPVSPIDRLSRRRPWAPWELRFLAEEYGGSLVADIARALNRGIDAVRAKVIALQLPRVRTRWSAELDEVVALMFPDASAAAVGELIGATAAAVRLRASQLGVQKAPGFAAEHSRQSTLARSPFTPEIAEVIELLYPDTLTQDIADLVGMPLDRVHAYATKHGWHKTPEFTRATARARTGPDHPMRKFQFKKGQVSPNKGVKGISYPGMEATQFKKGVRPHTWRPIGSLRINGDGYLDRKVTDTGYPSDDWKSVHRLVWVEANGEIPSGHVVRFKDGMRTTDVDKIKADILECISLKENARRNAWHARMPPELRKLMGTRIALTRVINRRQREAADQP